MGIAFADSEYPARAGFAIVNKILDGFLDISVNKWRSASEDSTDAMPVLEPALVKYQVNVLQNVTVQIDTMNFKLKLHSDILPA